jgi:uncharacterized repeat protein (TIGR01451 family)
MKSVSALSVALLVLLAALMQVSVTALAKAPPLAGPATTASIASSGPITDITISTDLNCAVNHVGDTSPEWYGTTACGTFIVIGGNLYGPASIPAGSSATGAETAAFTPVSQSATTGAGTLASPYKIVTVVRAATTGVALTETDTYVTGNEYYQTDVRIRNAGVAAINVILYRGGDCFLQNSDRGYGFIDPTGGIACQAGTATTRGTRIEEFKPITPGNRWIEDFYDTVWAAIGAKTPLPNTCLSGTTCGTYIDNAIALSWNLTIPAAGSLTVSSLNLFAPQGVANLVVTKTADQPTLPPGGGVDGYTITIANPNAGSATANTVSDTLPAGFTYRAGTTTGATTADPGVVGQTLTWTGPFSIPANGSITLHFQVDSATANGTYFNNATATSAAFGVTPSGNTAPITVGVTPTPTPSPTPTPTPTPTPSPSLPAAAGGPIGGGPANAANSSGNPLGAAWWALLLLPLAAAGWEARRRRRLQHTSLPS